MSANAKSIIAGLVAVVITALQAWSVITTGGVHLLTVLPVACAIVGALLTHVVPNVPELPWAKAVVSGALAVLTALTTFVGHNPSGVTAGSLLTVAAGAFLVWFVPNLPVPHAVGPSPLLVADNPAPLPAPKPEPAPAPVADLEPARPSQVIDPSLDITDALRQLDAQPAPVVVQGPPAEVIPPPVQPSA